MLPSILDRLVTKSFMPSLNLVNDHLDLANMVYSYVNLRLLMSLCVDIHSQLFVLLGSSVQASTSIIHHLIPSAQTLSHDLHRRSRRSLCSIPMDHVWPSYIIHFGPAHPTLLPFSTYHHWELGVNLEISFTRVHHWSCHLHAWLAYVVAYSWQVGPKNNDRLGRWKHLGP